MTHAHFRFNHIVNLETPVRLFTPPRWLFLYEDALILKRATIDYLSRRGFAFFFLFVRPLLLQVEVLDPNVEVMN